MSDKKSYAQALNEGSLSKATLNKIIKFMISKGMSIEKSPSEILKQKRITGYRPKLELYLCRGNRSWEGLIVGFPGTKEDLTTKNVGTPWLRKILYPLLVLQKRISEEDVRTMPCLYLIGAHFNDVFLRKFSFLKSLVPHVIVLTDDLVKGADPKKCQVPAFPYNLINENYFQKSLCNQMSLEAGLKLPSKTGKAIRAGFISYEFPTVEATEKPERLDILGYDLDDHSLVAFEIKGPDAGRDELENLFFQGLEHRNWLEENKMAVKLAFDGPTGNRISTRKRVKLVLGFCAEKVPGLFFELRNDAQKKDRHLQIEFCRFLTPSTVGKHVKVSKFEV